MAVDPSVSTSVEEGGPMLLTVKDLEAELQLGRTRTYELVRSGQIPAIRIGRVVRIPREALRRWVEAAARGSNPPPVPCGDPPVDLGPQEAPQGIADATLTRTVTLPRMTGGGQR